MLLYSHLNYKEPCTPIQVSILGILTATKNAFAFFDIGYHQYHDLSHYPTLQICNSSS